MQRFHRIFANSNDAFKDFLDEAQIDHQYKESTIGKTVSLLISESDERWPILAANVHRFDIFHTAELRYTKGDIRNASWCKLGVTSHFGYPQPEDDFEFQEITYARAVGCRECGIGLSQVAPFRFRKLPAINRSHLIQLNWVFGEYFVSSEARSHIETVGIRGIHFESPVFHKNGSPVPGWFQMKCNETLDAEIDTSDLTVEICSKCSQSKMNEPQGEMIKIKTLPQRVDLDVYRTAEWFGSGGSAYNLVLVSKRFATMILEMKWRGIELAPVRA